MKKTIVALAVAAAFTTPAFADNANVTVYGKAFLTFDQKGSNATGATSQMRVNTNASRFGVKGSEDLGDGLKALYQYEIQVDGDGSSVGGKGFGDGTRNSGVGIEGSFGKVMLGVWDTPFKVAHNKIELFDNTTSWTSTAVIGRSAGKNYNTRQANMIQYWSPVMSGLQASVMFSPDEAQVPAVGTKLASNKSFLSMAATFDQDDIYASVAYESRNDVASTAGGAVASATNYNGTDTAVRAVGRYNLADFWVGAMVESLKTKTSSTVTATGSNVELVGGYKMGPHVIAASYAKAGSTASGTNASNDVNQLSLKYGFNFSKRTELFAAYTSNKTNGGTLAVPTSTTLTYLGGGIVHSF